ncbi:MAG: hypothetical protein EHM83_06965 [Burkholderiales bacterium]|nr:MAG: hypothetical protein EHM83_06965 [Burkholderiales bacterium]
MSSWLRTALTIFVTLALPVQGFAAAAMISCGPGHERIQVASVGQSGHVDDGHHAGDMRDSHRLAHPHPGGADAGDAAGSASGAPVVSEDLAQLSELAKLDCSACAACCVAVAIMADPIPIPVSKMPAEAIALRAPPTPDPVFYRIEYPPRRLLD